MKKTRLFAAALAAVSAISFAPTAAQAATCRTVANLPETEVIVAGEPVATVPAIYLAVCGEISASSLPSLRYEPNVGDPSIFTIYLDVPADFYAVDLSLRYSIDGVPGEIPLGDVISGPSSICIFYTGPASMNPGGCLAGLNRG